MAGVRHLGFVGRISRPPTKSTWGYLSLYKILNILRISFENAHSHPFGGVLVENRRKRKFFAYLFLTNAIAGNWHHTNQLHKSQFCSLVSGRKQNFGSQKNYKPRESDTLSIRRDAHTGAILLSFGMRGNIADVITHAKFMSIGSGVWVSDTPKSALLHRLSWSLLQQCKHRRAALW